ncbi:MAG: hypothetical protein IJF83_00330 [Methanobrevibacter sp.]|nr:hypothetical protein [Methanobrevibacter sp.]
MKFFKVLIVMLILIMSVGAVCATDALSDDNVSDDNPGILENVQGEDSIDDNQEILENAPDDVYGGGEGSYTDLTEEITNSDGVLEMTRNYRFNNETDEMPVIPLRKDNFIINGNGHTIDANNQAWVLPVLEKI